MERRSCKLCSRTFSNGRALGGHMRSHMAALTPSPQPPKIQLKTVDPSSSKSSSSSSSSSSSEEEESKSLCYGLRENPKKSIRLVDPGFSFAADAGSVVQDRESETESSKNPIRRRSRRTRKSDKKPGPEFSPVSSVSDTSPEEDVALSLMMLSRDIWMREGIPVQPQFEDSGDSDRLKFCRRVRSKFQCGTCKKVFRSYQALGGHRASHKKTRDCEPDPAADPQKVHECPVCFRVFGSGQALGGHKRSHLSASAPGNNNAWAKFGETLIDLNLPAPIEDDDASQIALSAVSDAEFVHPPDL